MRVGSEKRAIRADLTTALADGDDIHDVDDVTACFEDSVLGLSPFSSIEGVAIGVGKNPGVLGVVNDVLDPNLSEGGRAF